MAVAETWFGKEIQFGAHLLNSVHIFPSRRCLTASLVKFRHSFESPHTLNDPVPTAQGSCKDVAWAILFLVVVAATALFAAFYFKDALHQFEPVDQIG